MRSFLTIHSSIYLVFALTLFFLPDQMWPLYGVEINDQYARFLSQHNSIFLGGIALIGFSFRNIQLNEIAYIQLLKGLAYTNLLGFIITLYACINGYFSGLGWSDPAFFMVLFVACFIQIKKVKKILNK
jgi:hypothetical protein